MEISLVEGDSFEEIFQNFNYKKKDNWKQMLSRHICDSKKLSFELKINLPEIKKIIDESLHIAFQTLFPKDISIFIFPTDNKFIINSMNGVGGFAPYKEENNVIFLYLHPSALKSPKEIQRLILHEYNHLCFHDQHVWRNLLASFIADGLADVYSTEILNLSPPPWSVKISFQEIKKYWRNLQKELERKDLHQKVFFGSEGTYPNWLGYSIGFQIINSFRKKKPKLNWKQILTYTPEEIFKLSRFEEMIK